MEQLSAPLVSSSEVDGGGGGGMRNHAVKPVIPPKPEGYGTLGRASSRDHHKSENGSATVEQNRLSYSSQRPKSTEMLTEFQIPAAAAAAAMAATMATTGTANPPSSTATNSNPATRQSPRSPRSKPPAPPVPNSPRPLPHQFSLADSQGSVLADLTLDCPCPLLTQQTGGGAGGGSSSSSSGSAILAGGSKHQSAYEPQLSVWNPLIEPPQLFQSAMDLDLSFDSGNIDPDTSDHQPQQPPPHHQPVIIKPAPPPPLSSMSFQSVQQFYPEPMKPTKVEPPRLPSVPPVSSSLTLNLSMDPLSSSRSISKTEPVKPVMPMANDLNKMMMSKLDHQSGGGGGAHHSSSSSSSSASSGGISAPPSVHSAMQRVEPRVTSDLVKLESNSMTMTTGRLTADPLAQSSTSSSVDTSSGAASSKPSRVLPLKPFADSSLSHNKASSVGCQSLESIQSNPSTIDTTDSPHSLLAPNESITARNALNSELHSRASASSSQPQQQQPNGLGRPTDSTDQASAAVTSKHNTSSSSSSSSAAAAASAPLSTPLLLPAPHPPPPPPPSSYMTIDIDPSDSSAAAAAATGSSSTGSGGGGGDSSGEKVVDFYPPNSFRPYSFHSECWRKEIPEDETKWQMYKRRFSEFVFNFVACCIRCIGPV
jgi:hypothetical protein